MYGHGHQSRRHPRAESLAYPGQFPECSQEPSLVPVQDSGPEAPDVCAGADHQHYHSQQALEVKECRHFLEKIKFRILLVYSLVLFLCFFFLDFFVSQILSSLSFCSISFTSSMSLSFFFFFFVCSILLSSRVSTTLLFSTFD